MCSARHSELKIINGGRYLRYNVYYIKSVTMKQILIPRSISDKVLMIGNYYKGNAVGGMAAVIRVYADYYESLRYIPSWRDVSAVGKAMYALTAYVKTFFFLLLDPKIEIVHIHSASGSSFYRKARFIKIAKALNRKVVLHMHSSVFMSFYDKSPNKEYIKEVLLKADQLVVLSESWKNNYHQICVPEDKIVIINNPVSEPTHKEVSRDKPVRMLFLGDLRERKGVWDILKALKVHKEEFRGVLEFRIGGNKREAELKQFIADNGLSDFVRFEGWVTGEKKWQLLNWANLMILPSHDEGLPITLLEAMSYSCALISTPVGGIPEILASGVNGIMVTPGNVEEIASAITYYISHPEKLQEHGSQSRKMVEPFLPSTSITQLKTLYQELLSR